MSKKDTQTKRDYKRHVHQQIKYGMYNLPDGSWRPLPSTVDPKTTGFMQT